MESDAEYNGALNDLNLCSRKKQNPFAFGLKAHCRAEETQHLSDLSFCSSVHSIRGGADLCKRGVQRYKR